MKVNWKVVSKSEGYRSLKAAMAEDITRSSRDKATLYRKFQFVISRATYYAYHLDTTIDVVLNKWEADRDYWWLNYYQDCNQPKKFHSNTLKEMGKTYLRKYYKKNYSHNPRLMRERIQDILRTKSIKNRWSSAKKARYKRICK